MGGFLTDRRILFCAATLRALGTAATGAAIGLYVGSLGLGASAVGLVTSSGMVGGALAMLFVTVAGDRFGRRRSLLLVCALGTVFGAAVLLPTALVPIVAVAFLALWNGMGRDRGPASTIEQAVLPATVDDAGRTAAFARYNALQDGGNALGFLLVAALLAVPFGTKPAEADPATLRAVLFAYPVLSLVCLVLYARLSAQVEAPERTARRPLSKQGRLVVGRISALFALDSLGGGFLTASLMSYFFFERFGASVTAISLLYFGARVLNAISHLAAGRLAKRIGLVNTMVFTHIPSSLLLATVAIAPSFEVAALLFLLREALVEMDVPTRQSYVMAVVPPEDRTVASGVTNLVRVAGWAVAPAIAGPLMEGVALAVPLVVGAVLKILYDLLLWRSFRHLRPPEERGVAS